PLTEEERPMNQRSKPVRYYSEEDVRRLTEAVGMAARDNDEVQDALLRFATKAKPLSLRPEVAAFAQAMEKDLQWPQVGGDVNKLFERLRFWAYSLTLE